MENISIQTSQNIAIEQPIASVGERIVAAGLDLIFIGAYSMFIAGTAHSILKRPGIAILLFLPVLLYHLVSEVAMDGQSWGKKIMKIKVVKCDGSQTTFSSYLIRWILRLIDVTLFFGGVATLVLLINGKGQRLGDIAAGTAVIRLKKKSFETEIYTDIPENYNLKYPQVSKLNDSDIAIAKEVVDFLGDSIYSEESREMAEKARKALENKMGIKSELGSEKFLKILILDYNYIHSR